MHKKRHARNTSAKESEQADPRSHIKAFFNRYPIFNYNGSEPVMSEFYRMCDLFRWNVNREGPERKRARDGIKDALTLQFNDIYGTDVNDLAAWQKLCTVLNLPDIPNELETCRKLVKSMFVNIVDLIDTPVTQVPVIHFESEKALSAYTKASGKYFPRDNIYAGDLLAYLLRHIMAPGDGKYFPRKRRPNN